MSRSQDMEVYFVKKIKSEHELNIIGNRIKEERKKAKLSQSDLSLKLELMGVYICRGSISRLESGVRNITDYEIDAISKILKVSPNELFDWDEKTKS